MGFFSDIAEDVGDFFQDEIIDPVRGAAGDVLRSEIGSMATLGLGEDIAAFVDPQIQTPEVAPLPETPDMRSEEVQAAIQRERARAGRGRAGNILTGSQGSGLTAGGQARATLLG